MSNEQSNQGEQEKKHVKSPLSNYGYPVPYYGGIAKILGQTEALVLALIDYWINYYKERNETQKHYKDNMWTVYMTISDMQERLPDKDERTLRRAVNNLSDLGVIIISHHSGGNYGRTNWYSIDYSTLADIMANNDKRIYPEKNTKKKIKADKMSGSEADKMSGSEVDKMSGTITELTTENTIHIINSPTFQKQAGGSSREELFKYITEDLNADENFANTIICFLESYTRNGYGIHPNIPKDKMLCCYDEYYNAMSRNHTLDYSDWESIINEYFSQSFKGKCDYKIFHFFTSGVLDNLYHHITDRAG